MELIVSANGGWCHVEALDSVECPICVGTSFSFREREAWIGHDKKEFFVVMVCDKCGKKLDMSLNIE